MQNQDNLLPLVLQQALSRAHPSPLPSNYVLTLVTGPTDPTQAIDSVATSIQTPSDMQWQNYDSSGAPIAAGWVWGTGEWPS